MSEDTKKEIGSVNNEIRARKLMLLETCPVKTFRDGRDYIIIPKKGPTLLKAWKNAEPRIR